MKSDLTSRKTNDEQWSSLLSGAEDAPPMRLGRVHFERESGSDEAGKTFFCDLPDLNAFQASMYSCLVCAGLQTQSIMALLP